MMNKNSIKTVSQKIKWIKEDSCWWWRWAGDGRESQKSRQRDHWDWDTAVYSIGESHHWALGGLYTCRPVILHENNSHTQSSCRTLPMLVFISYLEGNHTFKRWTLSLTVPITKSQSLISQNLILFGNRGSNTGQYDIILRLQYSCSALAS